MSTTQEDITTDFCSDELSWTMETKRDILTSLGVSLIAGNMGWFFSRTVNQLLTNDL